MNEILHERPGVYSVYDASAAVSGGRAAKVIGVAAKAAKGVENQAVTLTGYAAGIAAFGEDTGSAGMAAVCGCCSQTARLPLLRCASAARG